MKLVWALHARQCFSMFPKCTETKNIWQTVVSQLIKVFLPGREKHLVNSTVSAPTAVFHPPPSTELKPEHKYTSKTCSSWNTRKSESEQLVFNPELLGELKELVKSWMSPTTLCLKYNWKEWNAFLSKTSQEQGSHTSPMHTENQGKKRLYVKV